MFEWAAIDAIVTASGLSATKVNEQLTNYRNRYKNRKENLYREQRRKLFRAIYDNNLDVKFLKEFYKRRELDDNSYFYTYEINGTVIETVALTRPEWNLRRISLNLDDRSCRYIKANTNYILPDHSNVAKTIAAIERQGLTLYNREIYNMTKFQLDNETYYNEFSTVNFFDYKLTIGLVIDELYEALIETGHDLTRVMDNSMEQLPIREMLLPGRKSLLTPAKRICAGGVFVVFAAARPESNSGYDVLTHVRSDKVADNQESISVIPRAFHQHMVDPEREVNNLCTVFREIYEELLGGDEVDAKNLSEISNIDPEYYFHNSEPLQWIQQNLHNITIELVSYGFNGLSGNFEHGILFAIHDPEYHKKYWKNMKKNWEARNISYRSTLNETRVTSLSEHLLDPRWASETLPPMIESLIRLKEMQPAKVRLPEIRRLKGN